MGAAALFLGRDRGRLRRHADDGSATRCAARARELEVSKRLPYQGREITYVAARRGGAFHLYVVGDVECDFPMQRYDADVSTSVVAPAGASIVVLTRAGETLVFVGSHDEGTRTYTIGLSSVLSLGRSYDVETYDSERDAWQSTVIDSAIQVHLLGLSIEPGGYRIISLRSASAERDRG